MQPLYNDDYPNHDPSPDDILSSFWIQTHSGLKVHPYSPQPESINLTDIGHALSQQNRFNGHVRFPWPVAAHSMLVYRIGIAIQTVATEFTQGKATEATDIDWDLALGLLLHDAAEAYLPDITRPVKQLLREMQYPQDSRNPDNSGFYFSNFDDLEHRLSETINSKFNITLSNEELSIIATADLIALKLESSELMGDHTKQWSSFAGVEVSDELLSRIKFPIKEAHFTYWKQLYIDTVSKYL